MPSSHIGFVRAAVASAALFTLTNAQSTGSGDCTDHHIFLARGNNEPYPGRQGKLVEAICNGLDSCDYEDIVFNADLDADYCSSVHEGGVNGVSQIKAYNKKCPDATLIVSGYSQGAHIVGDVLGGGGGTFFNGCVAEPTEAVEADSDAGKKIAAAMAFGDVRHTAGQSYNVLGGASASGLYPRSGDQLSVLNTFSDVLHNYCQEQDPICAGGDVVAQHLDYFDVYTDSVATWVQSKVGSDGPSPTSTSSSASSTSTSTSTTTTTSSDSASSTTSSSQTPDNPSITSSAKSDDDDDSGAAPRSLQMRAFASATGLVGWVTLACVVVMNA
ncbi:Alpha/Beta hydrolase protein [Xylariomycetidae sp. FL0641]|nr:Alpha/Beta hydrolase protein [Xylariomycetidae sp. FL0641]